MRQAVNHNPGSSSTSPANQMYNSTTSRNRCTSEKKVPKTKRIETLLQSIDSPYKDSLSEIKQVDQKNDDSDDFKTPVPIRKVSKLLIKQQMNKCKKKDSIKSIKKTNKSSLFRTTKDNFKNLDVNPDNLQMALALSKSSFEAENPQCQSNDDLEILPDLEKNVKFGSVLERFGFKSNKTKTTSVRAGSSGEVTKKRKTSKFRYVTPTLITRTNEDREALITTKISFVLRHIESASCADNEQPDIEIFSENIRELYSSKSKITNPNLFNSIDLEENIYSVKSLNLPISKPCCGCLLKNWDDISGRDKSPERVNSTNTETSENNELTSNETTVNSEKLSSTHKSCRSPDLFDSDDEPNPDEISENAISTSPIVSAKSNIGLTTVFKSNSGIEHFESVCEDSLIVSRQISQILTETSPSYSLNVHNTADSSNSTNENIDNTNNVSTSALNGSKAQEKTIISNSNSSDNLGEKINDFSEGMSDNFQDNIKSRSLNTPNAMDSPKSVNESINCSFGDIYEIALDECEVKGDPVVLNNCSCKSLEERSNGAKREKSDNFQSNNQSIEIASDDDFSEETSIDKYIKNETSRSKLNYNTTTMVLQETDLVSPKRCDLEHFYGQEITVIKEEHSSRISMNNTDNLNVTDYVNKLLNQRNSVFNDVEDELKIASTPHANEFPNNSSQSSSSQESIVISDEELNYSCMKSEEMRNRLFYDLCSTDEEDVNEIEENALQDIQGVHKNLKVKYSQNALVPAKLLSEDKVLHSNSTDNSPSVIESNEKDHLQKLPPITEDVSQNYESIENEQALTPKKNRTSPLVDLQNTKVVPNKSPSPCVSSPIIGNNEKDIVLTPKNSRVLPLEIVSDKDNLQSTMPTNIVATPKSNLVIKATDVTPMANYDEMSSPLIRAELDKIGLKPLKRRRGIQLLKYIYETTHPFVDVDAGENSIENKDFVKRRKLEVGNDDFNQSRRFESAPTCSTIKIVGDRLLQNERNEDLIFEKKVSKKIPSCAVPLQIVWHNFLCCNPELYDSILLYEPLQLEVIHLMLKEQSGYKFRLEDLINFLDKKCITFRTSQWRNTKKR